MAKKYRSDLGDQTPGPNEYQKDNFDRCKTPVLYIYIYINFYNRDNQHIQ